MFFSPRMSTKELAGLCRRVATSLEAGIDARTVWAREAARVRHRAAGRQFGAISLAIQRGENLSEALAATGDFFPSLLRELVEVGDQTGHLGEIFAQLADHYQAQLKLRRIFLASITWPVAQLFLAVLVVGFLIWILGVIGNSKNTAPIDILGLGLVGNRGLLIYVGFWAIAGLAFFCVLHAIRRGLVWTRPIQRAVLRIPLLGPPLQIVALARLAWSLHLTLNTGMDVRRAMRLSLRSTRNARYTDQIERIDTSIASGNTIYESFLVAGSYPTDFIESLHVGEETGRLVESMAVLSRQYQDRARTALTTLTMLAGFGVWIAVAALIIVMIFRLFLFYIGTINDAMTI